MAKVLLVEDDNNLREIYEARLQAEGYEISSAQDGEEALVVAKQFKPDLIISDVMMPKISGFEMLDILRNTEGLEHTRVIMLTALGQAEDKTRADTLGADRYLVKSQVTLEDIVKSAHEILDGDGAVPAPVGDSTTPPSAPPVATDTTSAATPADSPVPAAPATPVEPVAAPVAEPVAEPPTEEPSPVEPTPGPAPETPAEPGASAAEAGTTASEQATVDEQIQDFIKNVPSETPAAEPASSDDALLSEAANSLAGKSPADTPVVATEPEPAAPAPEPVAEEPKPKPSNDNVSIAHKKVIEPPASGDKPSLDELLAREEAKESGLPVAPLAAPTASVPAEAEDFKLPEGASEDPNPAPAAVVPEPALEPAPEPVVPAVEPVAPEPSVAPEPASETPAEPEAAPTEVASSPAPAAPETPETPPAASTAAPSEPKKPTDFDPHSVAL